MTRDELRATLLACLHGIAPEVDVADLRPDAKLRDQVDLDSVDWMNFLVAVHTALGIDIPDADAARLTTLDQLIDFCARAAPESGRKGDPASAV
jgi:acyl carrier protein